jgi:hypothetical protein
MNSAMEEFPLLRVLCFGAEAAWVTQEKPWVTQGKLWVTLWKSLGDPVEIPA